MPHLIPGASFLNSFEQQTVVVLGGSSGIGLGIAQAAAVQEAKVILLSRSQTKLDAAAKAVSGNVEVIAVNMLDQPAVDHAIASIGTIDHLVLTAIDQEYTLFGGIESITSQQVERSFNKLRGYINVIRAANPILSRRASITMLSGAGALKPPKGTALAAAANAGIVSFTKALAVDLAPIRVNCLMPGPVDTPLHGDNLDRVRAWAQALPAQHFGRPADIAEAALFLMTNPYVTGHTLVIDGGYLLR